MNLPQPSVEEARERLESDRQERLAAFSDAYAKLCEQHGCSLMPRLIATPHGLGWEQVPVLNR